MQSPPPGSTAVQIVGKLLENPQQVAIVSMALGALALALLFALYQWGIPTWRAVKGRNGNGHIVVTEGAQTQRDPTIPPSGRRPPDCPEPEVSARELGELQGEVTALARGHRGLREDVSELTGTVAVCNSRLEAMDKKVEELGRKVDSMPNDTAELFIGKLLERDLLKDQRSATREKKDE